MIVVDGKTYHWMVKSLPRDIVRLTIHDPSTGKFTHVDEDMFRREIANDDLPPYLQQGPYVIQPADVRAFIINSFVLPPERPVGAWRCKETP